MNLDSTTRVFLVLVIVLIFGLTLSMFKVGATIVWGSLVVAIVAVLLRNEPQFMAAVGTLRAQFPQSGAST